MSDDIGSVTSDVSIRPIYNKATKPRKNSGEDSISSLSSFIIPKGHHHLDVYSITSTSQSHTLSDSRIDKSQNELFSGSVCTQDPIPLCAFTSSSDSDNNGNSQSHNSPENKSAMQSEEPPDCFDLHSSSLSPVPAAKKVMAESSNKSYEGDSDLRLSTLNEQGSSHTGLHSSSYNANLLQSKIMRDLSRSWKQKIEDEERLRRALTVPCTGPYHRLYGMSRIVAKDSTQRLVLGIDSRITLHQFMLYLCTNPKPEGSKIIVITKRAETINDNMIELWGPWSTFACGIYFRQHFNLPCSQEPPLVIFNPSSVNGANVTTFQNK